MHVTWAPSGTTYHQKTLTVDDKTSVIMTLNMKSADYAGTRDFAVIDTSKADVAAIIATFNADFAHKKITPPDGADLVWSPTNSQAAILAVIDAARHTLAVENEEMGDPVITTALEAAARRGVDVKIIMTAESEWDSAFSALVKAGAHVRTYKDSTSVLYIHAKAVVADAGRSGRADVRRLGELLRRQPAAQQGARHPHHEQAGDHGRRRCAGRRLRGRDPLLTPASSRVNDAIEYTVLA